MNEELLIAQLDQVGLSGKEVAQQMKDNLWKDYTSFGVVLRTSSSARQAVSSFNIWSSTRQGGDYWESVYKKLLEAGI